MNMYPFPDIVSEQLFYQSLRNGELLVQNNQLCQTRASHNGQHSGTSSQGYQQIAAKGYPNGQGQLIEDRLNAHLESIRALSDEAILHNSSRSRTRLACERCREKKLKCDSEAPCHSCKTSKAECERRCSIPLNPTIYRQQALLIYQDKQTQLVEQLLARQDGQDKLVEQLLACQNRQGKLAEQFLARVEGSEKAVEILQSMKSEAAVPLAHTTTAPGILSWRCVTEIIGHTLPVGSTTAKAQSDLNQSRCARTELEAGFFNAEPDLHPRTISRLISLYMNHFNIIHPILFPGRLKSLYNMFTKASTEENPSKGDKETEPKRKRKRSTKQAKAPDGVRSKVPTPSIECALFLLVLALGKMYDTEGKVRQSSNKASEQPEYLTSAQSGYPSPEVVYESCTSRPNTSGNILNIGPEAEYFTAATYMTEGLGRGDSLCYVQVQILTALYHKELGQFSKCHSAINEAAQALDAILWRNLIPFEPVEWDSALLLTFWTCLILESEINAELPFPQSSLSSTWERNMPWPNHKQAGEALKITAHIHSYQIQLEVRKHLSAIRSELYQKEQEKAVDISSTLCNTIKNLDLCILKIPPLPPTKSDDPSSSTTLATRLTAKISVAKATLLRPALMKLLNREGAGAIISPEDKKNARLWIHTLQRCATSISAFKDDHLLAYTQWGNLMILLAAFSDVSLSQFVHRDLLRDLVKQSLDSLARMTEFEQKYIRALKVMAWNTDLDHPDLDIPGESDDEDSAMEGASRA